MLKEYTCTCKAPPVSAIATMHDDTCAIWLCAMYNNELAEKRHITPLPPEVQAVMDAVEGMANSGEDFYDKADTVVKACKEVK